MIRRIGCAVTALIVAGLVLVAPVRAGAAPPPAAPAPGLCTVDEWQSPAKSFECARRLGNAAGRRVDCLHPPVPASPDAGIAGVLTTRPDTDLQPGVKGRYTVYGVGGYRMDMYDVSCTGGLTHPDAVMENAVAGLEFAGATAIIGAANRLREVAYDPGSMWSWSDGFVKTATETAYKYVFSIFGALALAIVGVFLLWRAHRGLLSEAVKVAGWALLVFVAVTGIAKYPLQSTHAADQVAVSGLSTMHRVLGPHSVDTPPERCLFGVEACKDRRTAAVRASDVAADMVLYRNWLRAELGSADSPTARKYGPALYSATALTWGEAADIAANPASRALIVDRKGEQFMAIAEAIKVEDPEAYANLQGLRGVDRAGAGFFALLSALIFSMFDTAASLVILFGFLVFRIAVVLLPTLATIGIVHGWSAGLRRLANMVVSACLNIILFGAGAGAYLMVVGWIFASTLPALIQLVGVFLAGLVCWRTLRPVKRLVRTLGRPSTDDRRGWAAAGRGVPAGDRPAGGTAGGDPPPAPRRPRPETLAGSRS